MLPLQRFRLCLAMAALGYRGVTEARDTALLCVLEHGLRASEVAALNIGDHDGVRLQIRQAKAGSMGSVSLFKEARKALNAYLGGGYGKRCLLMQTPRCFSLATIDLLRKYFLTNSIA